MSINLTDIKFQTVHVNGLSPALYEDDATGNALDFDNCTGTAYAILNLATMSEGWQVSITLQESTASSGQPWTDINEAAFDTINTAGIHVRSFARNKRYLRAQLERTGAPTLDLILIQAKE